MFEKIYRTDQNGQQVKISLQDLQIMANQRLPQASDLNLIYRSNTTTAFAALRLASWTNKDEIGREERVTKFLIEVGTYDATKPKGSRQKEYVQVYMDENDFGYFCSLLKNGRIVDFMAREIQRGNKEPYKYHAGVNESKRLRMYPGKKLPIILEAAKGPGKRGSTGQTLPDDWNGRNKDKVTKALIPLSVEEACKIANAGERAIAILDMWRAFGRDNENLALINVSPEKTNREQSDFSYNNSQNSYRNGSYQNRDAGNSGYAARPAQGQGYAGGNQGFGYQGW